MSDDQNQHAFASAGGLERAGWRLPRLRRLRLAAMAGIAAASLLPIAASAGGPDVKLGLPGLTQVVHDLAATVAANTASIASLQSGATTQGGQIALLQHQLDAQHAEIAALRAQVVQDKATGRAYTDAETTRATAAEGQLAAADNAGGGAATLAAAKAYTDAETARAMAAEAADHSYIDQQVADEAAARQGGDVNSFNAAKLYTDGQVAAEAAARQAGDAASGGDHTYTDQQVANESAARQAADSALQVNVNAEAARASNAETSLSNQINSEIARAQGAESALNTALHGEINRALSGEAAARDQAVILVQTSLTALAISFPNPVDFVSQVAQGQFP